METLVMGDGNGHGTGRVGKPAGQNSCPNSTS